MIYIFNKREKSLGYIGEWIEYTFKATPYLAMVRIYIPFPTNGWMDGLARSLAALLRLFHLLICHLVKA